MLDFYMRVGNYIIVTAGVCLLACGCSDSGRLPEERGIYSCPEFEITSHRILDGGGNVVFSAAGYSGGNPEGESLSLTTDFPLLDSLFSASVRNLEAGEGIRPQHRPHAIWLAEVFTDAERAREDCGADTLKDVFQTLPEALPWPASSDRSAMVTAAAETALALGDSCFTARVCELGLNTLRQDFDIAWSGSRNLLYGSQTYLLPQPDLYPEWMDAVDIYQSPCLGANVAAVGAVKALNEISGKSDTLLDARANAIRSSLGSVFFQPNLAYFSAYQYCYPYPVTLQASDNMAESLGVVLGAFSADTAAMIIRRTPVFDSATPTFFPMPRSWKRRSDRIAQPMVQSFRALASGCVRNGAAFRSSFAALLFTAAADSCAEYASPGIVGNVCRGLFGLDFTGSGISISPYVPDYLPGRKELRNLRYGECSLFFTLHGTGDSIVSCRLDGRDLPGRIVPKGLKGNHNVSVSLGRRPKRKSETIRNISRSWMPMTPVVHWDSYRHAVIANTEPLVTYQLLVDGQFQTIIRGPEYSMFNPGKFAVVNFIPVYSNTWCGFSQPPYHYVPEGTRFSLKPLKRGGGYVIPSDLPAGDYLVSFTYRVGDRTSTAVLKTHNSESGEPVVFLPHTGGGEFGRSSSAIVTVGAHRRLELKKVVGDLPEIRNVVLTRIG